MPDVTYPGSVSARSTLRTTSTRRAEQMMVAGTSRTDSTVWHQTGGLKVTNSDEDG